MDADRGARDVRGPDIEPDVLMREIASLRTYLAFVAGTFPAIQSRPDKGVSDLVQSVLGDVLDEIRRGAGRFAFRSVEELKSWLVNRLEWTHKDRERRRRRYVEILQALPPPPAPRTPGSEVEIRERVRMVAEARARLDPADRQLIEWRMEEGLTYAEIGRRRGYSTSYARRAWLGTRRRLRAIYLGLEGAASP